MNSVREDSSPVFRFLLGAGGLVLLIAGLKWSSSIVSPIILALILAFVFAPFIVSMRNKGLSAGLSLLITLAIIFIGGIGLLLFFGVSVDQLINSLDSYQTGAESQQADLQSSLADMGVNAQSVLQYLDPSMLFDVLGTILKAIASIIANMGLALFILAFMLFETTLIHQKVDWLKIGERPFILRFTNFGRTIRRYVVVLTWINLLVGIGDTIFLYLLGVPYPVLWGILSWFMGYIPSVGFWLAMVPPLLLGYAEGGTTTALLVLVGYVLINGSIQNVIQPKLMGDELNLSPLVVVSSLIFWTWVLGPLGALISVPMTMAVQQLVLDSSEGSSWLAGLMGATPPKVTEESPAE